MGEFYSTKLMRLPSAKEGKQIFKLRMGNKEGKTYFSKFKEGTKWSKAMILERQSPIQFIKNFFKSILKDV